MDFAQCHPAVNLIYFAAMFAGTIAFRQPVFLGISLLCAYVYSVKRTGGALRKLLLFFLILLICGYYGSFHHFGVTVLWHNSIGNPVTLEALVYGLTLGVTAVSCILWLDCLFSDFTTDKVVYLLGRVSPRLALLLSAALRMLPRLHRQAKKISLSRKGMGKKLPFFRGWVPVLSALITWLPEALIMLSQSMQSRGSLLSGRTAFSIYRFDNRDRAFVISLFACVSVTVMGSLLGQTAMSFDPRLQMTPITPKSAVFYAAYALLCLMPLGMELMMDARFPVKGARRQSTSA